LLISGLGTGTVGALVPWPLVTADDCLVSRSSGPSRTRSPFRETWTG